MAKGSRIEIFANKTGKILAEKICKDMGLCQDNLKITRFNDTEILPEIKESIRGADVFYICPFYPDPKSRLVETNLVGDAINYSFPNRQMMIPTYLGFTRGDWKPKSRTSINIRNVAENLEEYWDYVVTFHVHSPQIQGIFRIPFDSFLPLGIFKEDIESRGIDKGDIAVVAPDIGASDYAELFLNTIGASSLAIVYKKRARPGEAKAIELIGDVKDKYAIVVDDIIDTGGTIIEAAKICLERGARDVEVYATHGIFSKKIERINKAERIDATRYIETFSQDEEDLKEDLQRVMPDEGFYEPRVYKIISMDEGEEKLYRSMPAEYLLKESYIKRVVITDTIPRRKHYLEKNKKWLTQLSVVPMLEELIYRVHNDKSTSNLFKQ
ncbi:MAG: ribose-phosphate diphosphokinase [Candidatus Aenigmatarchaeota archaeon]